MNHEQYKHMHGQSKSLMKKAEFVVVLKGKKDIAEGTMAFMFEKPQGFQFRAGQHIRITLINSPETDSEGNSRFFSLASTPKDPDLVIAMRMRDTAFKRVLRQMQAGEKVLIQVLLDVPHGAFALHEDASKPAVFLVGGIGIVPAYSMIKDATEQKLPHKLFLFYSNRRPEDAPFLQELENLGKQNPNFTFVPTMTEAKKSSRVWQGETRLINQVMLSKHLNDFQSPVYYIAGLPEMVSAMKKLLKGLSVSDNNIQAEEFSGFDLNKLSNGKKPSWKRHVLFAVIVLLVIGAIALHARAAVAISNSDMFSFSNPLMYIMIGLMLVLLVFKLKHFHYFKQKLTQKKK